MMSCSTPEQVISGTDVLNPSFFHSLSLESDESLSIICALGAQGLKQSDLLNEVFDTTFTTTGSAQGIEATFITGEDSAVLLDARHHLALLNVEPFDGYNRGREELRERAAHFAVAVSDVIIFVTRMKDLQRRESNGLNSFGNSLNEMFAMEKEGVVPGRRGKKGFVIVVKEYEEEEMSREEVVKGVVNEVEEMFEKVGSGGGGGGGGGGMRSGEVFGFEVVLLGDKGWKREEYERGIEGMKGMLLDGCDDNYLFEGGMFSRREVDSVKQSVENVWNKLKREDKVEGLKLGELTSSFMCDKTMRQEMEKYKQGVKKWRREVEGGVIVENFGEQGGKLYEDIMKVYEEDAGQYKQTGAFRRKREELREQMDIDLYGLFVTQVAKLKQVVHRMFKTKVEEMEGVTERGVNGVMKEMQEYFVEKVKGLKPKFCKWRYENELKQLMSDMKEEGMEKLQRERLTRYERGMGRRESGQNGRGGGGTGKKRQPINVSFHYLDVAPFGWRDSRYEKLSVEDDLQYGVGNKLVPNVAPSGGDAAWNRRNSEMIYTERK